LVFENLGAISSALFSRRSDFTRHFIFPVLESLVATPRFET
jgi:hypothetical protein